MFKKHKIINYKSLFIVVVISAVCFGRDKENISETITTTRQKFIQPIEKNKQGKENASFIIFTDGKGECFAESMRTKKIHFSGKNATLVIQKAIDTITSSGGGKIYLKKGTYIITDTLWLKSNLTLEGEGIDRTVLRLKDKEDRDFLAVQRGIESHNIIISDLTLDCGDNINNSAIIMETFGDKPMNNAFVERVHIIRRSSRNGAQDTVNFGQSAKNYEVKSCILECTESSTPYPCVAFMGGESGKLMGNLFINSGIEVAGANHKIVFNHFYNSGISFSLANDILVQGNTFKNLFNRLNAIIGTIVDPNGTLKDVKIIGNTIDGLALHPSLDGLPKRAIFIFASTHGRPKNIIITDNIIKRIREPKSIGQGIEVLGCDGLLIKGNILDQEEARNTDPINFKGWNGISLGDIKDGVISENIVLGFSNRGVYMENSTNCIIANNKIKRASIGIEEGNKSDYNLIANNILEEVSDAAELIHKVGAHTVIENNIGFLTEKPTH